MAAVPNGIYTILNVARNRYLNNFGAYTQPGKNLVCSTGNHLSNDFWIVFTTGGMTSIRSLGQDVYASGANAQPQTSGKEYYWQLAETARPYSFFLKTGANALALNSSGNGAQTTLPSYDPNSTEQVWRFIAYHSDIPRSLVESARTDEERALTAAAPALVPDGIYAIVNVLTNTYLNNLNASSQPGRNLVCSYGTHLMNDFWAVHTTLGVTSIRGLGQNVYASGASYTSQTSSSPFYWVLEESTRPYSFCIQANFPEGYCNLAQSSTANAAQTTIEVYNSGADRQQWWFIPYSNIAKSVQALSEEDMVVNDPSERCERVSAVKAG